MVLERMAAHAQFCLAGDHTLEATQLGAEELAAGAAATTASAGDGEGKSSSSSSFLFVISDCNLNRYRIDPRELGEALTRHKGVRGHMFMIASRGDEAEHVR